MFLRWCKPMVNFLPFWDIVHDITVDIIIRIIANVFNIVDIIISIIANG